MKGRLPWANISAGCRSSSETGSGRHFSQKYHGRNIRVSQRVNLYLEI